MSDPSSKYNQPTTPVHHHQKLNPPIAPSLIQPYRGVRPSTSIQNLTPHIETASEHLAHTGPQQRQPHEFINPRKSRQNIDVSDTDSTDSSQAQSFINPSNLNRYITKPAHKRQQIDQNDDNDYIQLDDEDTGHRPALHKLDPINVSQDKANRGQNKHNSAARSLKTLEEQHERKQYLP